MGGGVGRSQEARRALVTMVTKAIFQVSKNETQRNCILGEQRPSTMSPRNLRLPHPKKFDLP